LLGHLDGLEQDVAGNAPKVTVALQHHPYFAPVFTKLREELRLMYGSYGSWKSLDIYEPLKKLANELLELGGIEIESKPDGSAHVNIPFTAETTATEEEKRAYFLEKNGYHFLDE
jgi:hypothetical protein